MSTKAIEDYAKAIYKLQQRADRVSTSALAEHLAVTPASVSGMLRKLEELNLIEYEPYRGVELTAPGMKVALEVIRHHRLIELFLAESLGLGWDEVHAEAERLEHVISEQLEDHIDRALGHPRFDPHGDPIPTRDGTIVERVLTPLAETEVGAEVLVAQVSDHDPELLRYLGDRGLYPGTRLRVLGAEPFEGPLTIEVDGESVVLGRAVARYVRVVASEEEEVPR